MRVNLVGNVCNNHYRIAKALRAAGVEAHLYYHKHGDLQTQPASDDPEVKMGRLSWLHPFTASDSGPTPHLSPKPAFIEELRQCDLLHVQDSGLLWAKMTGRPYIWHPYGSDIMWYPFTDHWNDSGRFALPQAYQQAISSASAIIIYYWYDCWAKSLQLIEKLGVRERIVHVPLVIDTQTFSPASDPSAAVIFGRVAAASPTPLLLFHPSRQFLKKGDEIYFGNDLLYRALGRLKREGLPFKLVIVEKGNSQESEARVLIQELGIADDVRWVPAMARRNLIEWYRAADITVAELAGGSFGSIGFEALACGCALMNNFHLYSDNPTFWPPPATPPLINVTTEDDIVREFRKYSEDRQALTALGRASRMWIEQNSSYAAVAIQLNELYKKVLSKSGKAARGPFGTSLEDDEHKIVRASDQGYFEKEATDLEKALYRVLCDNERRILESGANLSMACKQVASAILKRAQVFWGPWLMQRFPRLVGRLRGL